MNTYPALTNVRSQLSDTFSLLQTRAVRAALWAKLTGKNTRLTMFPEQAPQKSPNRRFIGVKEICIAEVVGTLNRHSDFDHKFRPLKSYLRDRWVNVYLTLQNEGWSPIIVHKVGNDYYVEDGHHRLSVARLLGMTYIQANVWEYPVQEMPAKKSSPARCPERSSATVYVAQ